MYFKTEEDVSSIKVGLLSISAFNSRILIRGGGRTSFDRRVVDNGRRLSLFSRDGLELFRRFDRIPVDGERENIEFDEIFDDR